MHLARKELNWRFSLIWARQPPAFQPKSTSMGEAKAILHHGELIYQWSKMS